MDTNELQRNAQLPNVSLTSREIEMEQKVVDAINKLEHLAERWETTPEWHKGHKGRKKDFTVGEIHITTGDLKQLAVLINHHKQIGRASCRERV